MKNDAQKFIDCLEEAGGLLENHPGLSYRQLDHSLTYTQADHFKLALFEDWSDFCEPEFPQKTPIRIIQHLSCTGGTLISKCLTAMPNVVLLSEVHPLSRLHVDSRPRFAPTDITYLALWGGFPFIDELSEKIFRADIDVISQHVRQLGKYLVIREHSHSDFMVGESPTGFSTIKELLKEDYPVLSVVTVRHPVDSYLSLLNNGWVHFVPETFDEYCRRYLLFIEQNEGLPVCKYEEFVQDPETELKALCDALDLPFNEDFEDVFDLNIMSGDSGRSSAVIAKRERRSYDDSFRTELRESSGYSELCKRLAYEPSLE
jgi:hypothetical protein